METKQIMVIVFTLWMGICGVMIIINEAKVFELSQSVRENLNTNFNLALDNHQKLIGYHQNALMWFALFIIGYGGARFCLNLPEGGLL